MIVLVAPFVEELFFRGIGVRALTVFGTLAAILLSGVIFGAVHGILGALPPLALFGIGLAWIRVRSASIWPGFIAHATYNGIGIALPRPQLGHLGREAKRRHGYSGRLMRPSDPEHDPVVHDLRQRITEADRTILEAANTRLQLVRELREHKIARGWEFLDPGREERLLDDLARENPGPLSEDAVRQLFVDLLALTKRE